MLRAVASRSLVLSAFRPAGAVSARAACAPRRAFSDSHDDFAPQTKPGAAGDDVSALIEADISGHDVFLYMKGTPAAPQCGFSNMAVRILDAHGVKFGSRNVLSDPAVREGVKAFSAWPTIPQVFIKGEFVGGSDILYQMHQSGDLEKQLEGLPREDDVL